MLFSNCIFKVIRQEFYSDHVVEPIEVKDLVEHALFLGDDSSISISTRESPMLKRKCIYFSGT